MKKTEDNEFLTEFLEMYPGINLLEPNEAMNYYYEFIKNKSNEKK